VRVRRARAGGGQQKHDEEQQVVGTLGDVNDAQLQSGPESLLGGGSSGGHGEGL